MMTKSNWVATPQRGSQRQNLWINGMDAHFLKRHQSAKVEVA
jgi:hypothetical protein